MPRSRLIVGEGEGVGEGVGEGEGASKTGKSCPARGGASHQGASQFLKIPFGFFIATVFETYFLLYK